MLGRTDVVTPWWYQTVLNAALALYTAASLGSEGQLGN